MIVFLGTRLFAQTVFIPHILSLITLVMGMTVVWRTVILVASQWVHPESSFPKNSLLWFLPAMLIHGAITLPVFHLLDRIDQFTGKKVPQKEDKNLLTTAPGRG